VQFADAIADGEFPGLIGDGTQTRDFTHMSNMARACELAADHKLTRVYNISTQEAYSFIEVVAIINDALGTEVDPRVHRVPLRRLRPRHDG
jgi:UDP-glucose 4-epimerase